MIQKCTINLHVANPMSLDCAFRLLFKSDLAPAAWVLLTHRASLLTQHIEYHLAGSTILLHNTISISWQPLDALRQLLCNIRRAEGVFSFLLLSYKVTLGRSSSPQFWPSVQDNPSISGYSTVYQQSFAFFKPCVLLCICSYFAEFDLNNKIFFCLNVNQLNRSFIFFLYLSSKS